MVNLKKKKKANPEILPPFIHFSLLLLYGFRRSSYMDCFNGTSFLKLESFRLKFFYIIPFVLHAIHPLSRWRCEFLYFSVTLPNIPSCSSQLALHPDSVLMFILLLCNALLYTHTPHPSQKQSKIYPLSVAKWEDYPFIIVSEAARMPWHSFLWGKQTFLFASTSQDEPH